MMNRIKSNSYMDFLIRHYNNLSQSLLKLEASLTNYEKGTNEWHAAIGLSVGSIERDIAQVRELTDIPEAFTASHEMLLESMRDFERMAYGLSRWVEYDDREMFAYARGFEHLSKKKWEEARIKANSVYLEERQFSE